MPARLMLTAAVLFAVALASHADEGMWLPDRLPAAQLQQRYGFSPDDAWMTHLRRSCLRFGRGGSAAFVSPNGLIMTNHHVGATAIADLGDAEHDYLRDGFYAPEQDTERQCPGVEVFNLRSIRDVTSKMNAGIKEDTPPAKAAEIRDANAARLEQEASSSTGLQPEIVKLYGGMQYHLYLYKKYTDVRLVFAPEQDIAFFGGDIRNFEFPRYDLDVAFFRAYEDGKPVRCEHHLAWSTQGVAESDLVFVVGHPYRTRRLYTMDHLRLLRDRELPLILGAYNQLEVDLIQFMSRGAEEDRIARDLLHGVQNGRKAFGGIHAGLLDAAAMAQKLAAEKRLRAFIAGETSDTLDPWTRINTAVTRVSDSYTPYFLLENRRMRLGTAFRIARHFVRYAEQLPLDDADRLPEYRSAALDSLRKQLIESGPLYPDLERLQLRIGLTRLARWLGAEDAVVQTALAGQTPTDRAAALIAGTRLLDKSFREELLEGGPERINAESGDTLLAFARTLDPTTRRLRKTIEDELDSVAEQAYARIATAQYALDGDSVYPDATGTLRVSFGTIKAYEEGGKRIVPLTRMAGAFAASRTYANQPPFHLPKAWLDAEGELDPATPFNFVSTVDIIGGNSGSPTVDRNGAVVGIIFDGNIQSLSWDIQYSDRQARGVHVDARAITAALGKVYRAEALVSELQGSARTR